MTSSRPYLIRAIRDWIQDNGLTPYILVQADVPGTVVPESFVDNGRIVLNLSERAIKNYHLDGEWLSFSARFSGRSLVVEVPVEAILAIYARENGEGMVFEPPEQQTEDARPAMTAETQDGSRPNAAARPHLELIKG